MVTYVRGLLGELERKNGWTLAEAAGDATPDGMQRLLNFYAWDCDDVREIVVETIGDETSGVLIVDETGFLKKASTSDVVARRRHPAGDRSDLGKHPRQRPAATDDRRDRRRCGRAVVHVAADPVGCGRTRATTTPCTVGGYAHAGHRPAHRSSRRPQQRAPRPVPVEDRTHPGLVGRIPAADNPLRTPRRLLRRLSATRRRADVLEEARQAGMMSTKDGKPCFDHPLITEAGLWQPEYRGVSGSARARTWRHAVSPMLHAHRWPTCHLRWMRMGRAVNRYGRPPRQPHPLSTSIQYSIQPYNNSIHHDRCLAALPVDRDWPRVADVGIRRR